MTILLCSLAIAAVVLNLWQWVAAQRFPLEEPKAGGDFKPAVTALKPLKGCDTETERCLESWFKTEYPAPVQLLFGAASAADPVCDIVRALIARYPQADAELLICGENLGPNAKVSTLIQLERRARHGLVVISDADVRIPRIFFPSLVAPLAAADVGLVNCLYRAANPQTFAMRWEAISVNADFWSQVLQSRSMRPLDFALGAVMAVTREQLGAVGGFPALVEYLADDYQLGHRIARAGKRVELCSVVVEGWESPRTWREVWRHQLRWARTFRFCTPALYFFSILNNVTLWSSLAAAVHPTIGILALAAGCLLLRMATALHNEAAFTKSWRHLAWWWLIPIKDVLNVLIWVLAFLGNHVEWRGHRYRVLPGGKLVALDLVGNRTNATR